jgi:DNA-binding NtrC family response regulator
MTGLELIREMAQTMPPSERPQVLMMTAHATVESAIEAMKLGALDYLQKPFEVEELLALVSHALEHQRLRSQRQYLISERSAEFNQYGIVGRSRAMQEVIQRAELVAQTKSTVLIMGETGTGRRWSRAPFIIAAPSATCRSSRSIARRFPRRCSNPSCSATSAAPSPGRR